MSTEQTLKKEVAALVAQRKKLQNQLQRVNDQLSSKKTLLLQHQRSCHLSVEGSCYRLATETYVTRMRMTQRALTTLLADYLHLMRHRLSFHGRPMDGNDHLALATHASAWIYASMDYHRQERIQIRQVRTDRLDKNTTNPEEFVSHSRRLPQSSCHTKVTSYLHRTSSSSIPPPIPRTSLALGHQQMGSSCHKDSTKQAHIQSLAVNGTQEEWSPTSKQDTSRNSATPTY